MGKSLLMSMVTTLVVSLIIFFSCVPLSTTTLLTTTTVSLPVTISTTTTIADTISTIPTTHTTPTIPITPPLNNTPSGSIHIERVFFNLSFKDMTNLVQPDDASGLIFVTEQRGVIYAFHADQPQQGAYIFLDITDRVNQGGSEEGLLGFVFDPDYRENGHFYVYYSGTNPRRSVVSRFSLDQGNPIIAAPQSEVIIMEVGQPFSNHNGGQLAFGPDGYLYIGLGDGGSAGDPQRNGQNMSTLLGKILRIDVNAILVTGNYRIPSDNPFVNTAGARAEIWAFGLRNPWRFSFDKETNILWAGDVGQNIWEEIDIITKGANYGWNVMEGFHCYSPATGCDKSGITLPIAEYNHSQGCSVTGGYVYRGDKIPSLQGFYIYGDYCSGNIWALAYDGNTVTQNILLAESGLSITSFGEDIDRNLYILSGEGGIYTIV
jgi:glucose/arabinose dehydrogenase